MAASSAFAFDSFNINSSDLIGTEDSDEIKSSSFRSLPTLSNSVLQCPLCSSPFSASLAPHLLKCGHTFCEQCLVDRKQVVPDGFSIECHACKTTSEYGASQRLPLNSSLIEHIAAVNATLQQQYDSQPKCKVCGERTAEYGCAECTRQYCSACWGRVHFGLLAQHVQGPLAQVQQANCSRHPTEITHFVCADPSCPSAGELMCSLCERTAPHQGHRSQLIEDVIQGRRKQLQDAINRAQFKVAHGLRTLVHVRQTDELLRGGGGNDHTAAPCSKKDDDDYRVTLSNQEQARSKIRSHFDELRLQLQRREEVLIQAVDSFVAEKAGKLADQKLGLADFLSKSYSAIHTATDAVQNDSDRQFLSSYRLYLDDFEQLPKASSSPVINAFVDVSFGDEPHIALKSHGALVDDPEASSPAEFDGTVFESVKCGQEYQLKAALATHSDLIDAANPRENNQTPLYQAALIGNVSAIELLVQAGSKAIDTANNDGWTPMHAAASEGRVLALDALLQLGSKAIDAADRSGNTPLSVAAKNGHVQVIEALVRQGSQAIDVPNNNGWTPLNTAAQSGHVSVIEALVRLDSQAIDTPNTGGWTPLLSATLNGHVGVIEALVRLESQAIDAPNNQGYTPMYVAALKGHLPVIEALIRLGSKAIDTPSSSGSTPLYAGALSGFAEAIKLLVSRGSKAIDTPNDEGWTPMFAAASNGNIDVINTLIELRSQAMWTQDKKGETPLQVATRKGHQAVAETLAALKPPEEGLMRFFKRR